MEAFIFVLKCKAFAFSFPICFNKKLVHVINHLLKCMTQMIAFYFGSSHQFHRSCLKCHIMSLLLCWFLSDLLSVFYILQLYWVILFCLEWLSILVVHCYLNLTVILNHLWSVLKILDFLAPPLEIIVH